eukprot:GHVS01104274.1.p1 GENE.GHVS01104274.1~~GHVS01104274.1.p1  ORF type:complete len:535 (-),score=96.61 GHVS01104274.1:772-2376(-)
MTNSRRGSPSLVCGGYQPPLSACSSDPFAQSSVTNPPTGGGLLPAASSSSFMGVSNEAFCSHADILPPLCFLTSWNLCEQLTPPPNIAWLPPPPTSSLSSRCPPNITTTASSMDGPTLSSLESSSLSALSDSSSRFYSPNIQLVQLVGAGDSPPPPAHHHHSHSLGGGDTVIGTPQNRYPFAPPDTASFSFSLLPDHGGLKAHSVSSTDSPCCLQASTPTGFCPTPICKSEQSLQSICSTNSATTTSSTTTTTLVSSAPDNRWSPSCSSSHNNCGRLKSSPTAADAAVKPAADGHLRDNPNNNSCAAATQQQLRSADEKKNASVKLCIDKGNNSVGGGPPVAPSNLYETTCTAANHPTFSTQDHHMFNERIYAAYACGDLLLPGTVSIASEGCGCKAGKSVRQCGICLKTFQRPYNLKVHMKTHACRTLHRCQWPRCGKAFTHPSHLKVHQRIHTGDMLLTCSWNGCGKRFTRKPDLEKHTRIHTGQKPYLCTFCGCSFSQSNNAYSHVIKKHDRPQVVWGSCWYKAYVQKIGV